MVIPAKARELAGIAQGDIVEVNAEGDGRLVLVRLERSGEAKPIKAKITYRRGRHRRLVRSGPRTLPREPNKSKKEAAANYNWPEVHAAA